MNCQYSGFTLLKIQQHDIAVVKPLIKNKEFGVLLADRAFDADCSLLDLEHSCSKAVIPPKYSCLT